MPLNGARARLGRLWNQEIWQPSVLGDRSPRGRIYAAMRAVSTLTATYTETHTASRAADLSFSSLLGLGPLIAIAVMVASTLFGDRNPNLAVDALDRLIGFVAPQLGQYEALENGGKVPVNPELVSLLNGFIAGARSEMAGVVGAAILVVIVLFLFKAIEDAFNEIWGVRRRTILARVAIYWTILTLGGVLFFASAALLGAGAFVNVFVGRLPFGAELVRMLRWSIPLVSFVILTAVLALFYRAIPNTRVRWVPALSGALVVALLLTANNFLQFLYLRRVLLTKSLFGSLGIIPVLMFGLWIFWIFVLIGGQISYAVQNIHVRSSRLAWGSLSAAGRDRLSLAVLMAVCRRFQAGEPAVTVAELSEGVRLPTQVVNECLNRIVDAGFVVPAAGPPGSASDEARYRPSLPLSRITLFAMTRAADRLGEATSGEEDGAVDPAVARFEEELARAGGQGFLGKSVEQILLEESAAG